MGSNSSKELDMNTDVIDRQIKKIIQSLTDKDKRLVDFAMKKIAKEPRSLENVEVFLRFADRDAMTVRARDVTAPRGRIYIAYDEGNKYVYEWERESFRSKASYFFVESLEMLIYALRDRIFPAIVDGGLKAIKYI